MELEEYRTDLIQNTMLSAAANLDFDRSEFIRTVMDLLIDSEIISEFVPCHYEGNAGINGKRIEIDGYNYDEDDKTFSLIVCAFSGSKEMQKITKTDVEKLADRARAFIEAAENEYILKNIDESEDAFELAKYVSKVHSEVERYRVLVLSDSARSDRMDKLGLKDIGGKVTVPELWDVTNLYNIEIAKKGYDEISIDFADFGSKGIPCLSANNSNHGPRYDSYLCVMPGTILSLLYEKYGSRLLESNVRSFLSTTTKANKEIRATIMQDPDMFFAYNNGITATATEISFAENDGGRYVINLTALQIVNGGQTTVSIYNAGKKEHSDLSRIYVPMKISIIPTDEAGDIVPRISRSANIQNTVSEADFFSNHPFHIRMEQFSRRVRPPAAPGAAYSTKWYYERVRGQYRQDKNRNGKQFMLEYPDNQLFTKMDLARYRMCYNEKPYYLIQGWALREFAKEVGEKWIKNESQYNELYYKETVALGIIYKTVNNNVSNQIWYQTGAKAEVVAYTMSKFFSMIKRSGKILDLARIWNLQKTPAAIEEQLMLIAERISISINDDKEEANIRSWCKKQKCWDKINAIQIELKLEVSNFLVKEGTVVWQQRVAKRDQTQRNKMDARIEVVNLGPGYWNRMFEWGVEYQMLDKTEQSILKTAFEKGERSLPSEPQSAAILKMRDRLLKSGFK